jgi:uncharacterized repeat protein (TIGR01451 family)
MTRVASSVAGRLASTRRSPVRALRTRGVAAWRRIAWRRAAGVPAAACVAAAIGLLAAGPAAAQPTLLSSYQGFIDANGNGVLDCGEPVKLTAAFATNSSGTPALSGSLFVPATGSSGLIYQPGSLKIEQDLTVGCQAVIASGNSPEDLSGQVDFKCPPDPLDSNSWTVVVSYRAVYYNAQVPSFTAAANLTTAQGLTLHDATTQPAGAVCSSRPAGIAVAKSAAGPGTPGSVLLYTITATDTSGLGAGGVQLVDAVPANTSFDAAASSPGWSCAPDGAAGALCRNQVGNLDPNGSLSRFFAVTIDNPLPAGVASIGNTACARLGPSTVAGCGSTTTPTAGAGALHLSKTLAGGSAAPGATLTFALSASNTGNQGLAGVVLAETVPANTSFAAAGSSAGWSCTPGSAAGAACTLGVGTLAAGASAARTFALRVVDPLPAGVDHVANAACARAPGSADGCDSVSVPTAGMPAIKLAKSLAAGSGVPGTRLVYDVLLQNTGDQDAAHVTVTDTVPVATTFEAAGSPGWSCAMVEIVRAIGAGAVCTGFAGPLAAGASVHLPFAVALVNPIGAGIDKITNTACAQLGGAGGPVCDTVASPVVAAPHLTLAKGYGGGPAHAGDTLVYDLALGNSGNQDAGAVSVSELVPEHTSFAPQASSPGWSCAPGAGAGATCTLAVGALPAGTSLTRTFAVAVDAALPPEVRQIANNACVKDGAGNTACGRATTPPPVGVGATLRDALARDPTEGAVAHPGDVIEYTLVVGNSSAGTARDLDVATSFDTYLVFAAGSVTTTAGTILLGNRAGDPYPAVHLAALAPGESVTIGFRAMVAAVLPPTLQAVSAQSSIHGGNAPATVSDDPDTPEPLDPTATPVAAEGTVNTIPTLGGAGLAGLAALLGASSLLLLRRRAAAGAGARGGR